MEQASGLHRWPAVKQRTGLSRTTVWRKVREGSFPAPVQLSAQTVAWREADLAAWERSLQPVSRMEPPTSGRRRGRKLKQQAAA